MNPRKPIIAMLAIGIIVLITLSFIPYSLTVVSRAGQTVAAVVGTVRLTGEPLSGEPPKPPAPTFDVAVWYMSRGGEPEKHGVLIEAIDGQRVFASHNADTAFNPASLIKLATSVLALRRLGADYRFETTVFADGEVDKKTGTLRGKLYLIGRDPTFGDVAAHLVGEELRARGIKRVSDGVFVSPEFSFNYSESAEKSAEHVIRVARIGPVKSGVAEEPAGRPLFVFKSYPLREILLYLNAHSSNFVAERVADMLGGAASVERMLVDELKLPPGQVTIERASGRGRNRLTARGVVMVIRALAEEAKQQGLKLEDIMPVANDDAGTLRRRLAESPLEGAVVGKTGTLTAEVDGGMASLGGIVYTRDAGMIAFAILDQGSHISENRQLEDELLAEVISVHDLPVAIPKQDSRKLLPSTSLRIEPVSGAGEPAFKSQ